MAELSTPTDNNPRTVPPIGYCYIVRRVFYQSKNLWSDRDKSATKSYWVVRRQTNFANLCQNQRNTVETGLFQH